MQLNDLMNRLDAEANPGLDADRIDAFELTIGYRLPAGLRQLLMRANGGDLTPSVGTEWESSRYVGGKGSSELAHLFGIDKGPYEGIRPLTDHFAEMEVAVEGTPPGIFVIGDDWCGNAVTVDLADETRAAVGWVDHETVGDRFDDPETYAMIAASFDNFVEMLQPVDEDGNLVPGAD